MILYKYVPPERVDVLQSGLIAFTPPWLFNDPFEASPVLRSDALEAIALFEANRATRATLTAEEESALQATIGAIQHAHGVRRIVLEQAARSVGVLSLSETRDCALMWAHYTAQHTGFVIGFDAAHSAWVESGRLNGPPGEPTKVTYSADRPSPAAIADVTPEHIWYTKSREWAHEREWRVTRRINRAVKTVQTPAGDEVPLHAFPREAVREVILGQRAETFSEFEILELVTRPPYKDVTVLRAEMDPTQFKINIVPR
jgi:Protein of unknown function (DUF2971)